MPLKVRRTHATHGGLFSDPIVIWPIWASDHAHWTWKLDKTKKRVRSLNQRTDKRNANRLRRKEFWVKLRWQYSNKCSIISNNGMWVTKSGLAKPMEWGIGKTSFKPTRGWSPYVESSCMTMNGNLYKLNREWARLFRSAIPEVRISLSPPFPI